MTTYKEYLTSRGDYLLLLSGLKTFISAVRGYKSGQHITIGDVLEFVDLMNKNNLPLLDTSKAQQAAAALNLLTSHKAKGLEFETVFVLHCNQKSWQGSGKNNKISLPQNLPLLPEKDNSDDARRLFYVALTRAKKNLFLTNFLNDEKGKQLADLEFLADFLEQNNSQANHLNLVENSDELEKLKVKNAINSQKEQLQVWLQTGLGQRILSLEEKDWLRPTLENYQLSVTHLNNFLDVTNGGPQKFLEINLLRFPQSKQISSSYGSAMHKALKSFYRQFQQEQILPEVDFLLQTYERALFAERLAPKEFSENLKKGQKYLSQYFQEKREKFSLYHKLECDFRQQQINLGSSKITGQIDKMEYDFEKREILVSDFKTGRPSDSWQSSDWHEKIKLDRYRRQLIFYKLLVENSRDWGGKFQVKTGRLEFLEPDKKTQRMEVLELEISQTEAQELAKLIEIVYSKIQNLDFPSVEDYSRDVSGTWQFIEDLRAGKI